uniref:Uncharacterized protein n=1 Tax=Desertifilum tharense IPPAS B-1220 TaxID=1781255 RepID=A0ACD5GVT3_9CYAN
MRKSNGTPYFYFKKNAGLNNTSLGLFQLLVPIRSPTPPQIPTPIGG